jgi:hypothetical protein
MQALRAIVHVYEMKQGQLFGMSRAGSTAEHQLQHEQGR